jgi:hypothetical protein
MSGNFRVCGDSWELNDERRALPRNVAAQGLFYRHFESPALAKITAGDTTIPINARTIKMFSMAAFSCAVSKELLHSVILIEVRR